MLDTCKYKYKHELKYDLNTLTNVIAVIIFKINIIDFEYLVMVC